jgi:hypothetical protein
MRHGRVILRPQPRWVGDDRTIAARSLDRGDVPGGSLVRWAARYPTLNIQLDGLYLTWTEVGPRTYTLDLAGPDGVREWDRLKAYNVESDADILDGDFSNDGSPITPLIIDDTTPSSSVPAVYLHGVVTV